MTEQDVRKFIELTDVTGVKLTCKHCESALTVSLEKFSAWVERQSRNRNREQAPLTNCQVCMKPLHPEISQTISSFILKLNDLTTAIAGDPNLSLALEIRGKESSAAAK